MHSLYLITADLELYYLIGAYLALLDKPMTGNNDEEFPFGIMQVLSLCDTGL
jgi:hypothetical protein